MHLERFIAALGSGEIVNPPADGGASVEISDLAYDTRAVVPGALFFCVRGRHVDGHLLAPEAAAHGAAALVVERELDDVELPQLVVADTRRAMARAAVAFFGDPSRELDV